jgi:hypothetical protein
MQRKSTLLLTVALLLAPSTASADFLKWRYNWTPSTLKVVSDTTPSNYVQLSGEPIPHPKPAGLGLGILRPSDWVKPPPDNSDIAMTGIKVISDAPRGNPDVYRAPGPGLGLGILHPRQPENRGGR